MKSISPKELQKRLAQGDSLELIDIREPFERQLGKLPDHRHLPLSQLASRHDEIAQDGLVVLYCHNGERAALARDYLLKQGFKKVYSLEGGSNGWAEEVDENVAQY